MSSLIIDRLNVYKLTGSVIKSLWLQYYYPPGFLNIALPGKENWERISPPLNEIILTEKAYKHV